MYDMLKYHMLKTYIKHKKHNFITLPISNKIIIKKMAQKLWFTYIITLFFSAICWFHFINASDWPLALFYNNKIASFHYYYNLIWVD